MMKENVLIGAGGFAREIKAHINNLEIKCFVDDEYFVTNDDNIHKLSDFNPQTMNALIAVGNPNDRKRLVERMPSDTEYFTYIHPSAQILDDNIYIGEGSIIAANCILTTNIKIGKHAHLNLSSTVGHDCVIGDYFTTAPGAKISGNCNIGECVYFGTNASVREKITICDDVTVGLNAGVVKSIDEPGIYVGVPSKKLSK